MEYEVEGWKRNHAERSPVKSQLSSTLMHIDVSEMKHWHRVGIDLQESFDHCIYHDPVRLVDSKQSSGLYTYTRLQSYSVSSTVSDIWEAKVIS